MASVLYSRCHLGFLSSYLSLGQSKRAQQRHGAQILGVMVLSRLLQRPVSNDELKRNAAGAPVHAEAYISLSHSGDWVAAAAAFNPVGIDVEVVKPGRPLAAMAAQFDWPEQQFYGRWCTFEAALKTGVVDISGKDIRQHRGQLKLPSGQYLYSYTSQHPLFMSIACVTNSRPKWQSPVLMADEYLLESPAP
ncbi:4'-phosphopantetheinyl transferase family protein [Gallaecimonas sp. GXIMD1310]|uniref:4'-phosphopantetheinyl transferase family protein n=1 Tax=Gallaecimonas sp. GXIMD1310 TaxID=3131926 RepID=UPI00324743F4